MSYDVKDNGQNPGGDVPNRVKTMEMKQRIMVTKVIRITVIQEQTVTESTPTILVSPQTGDTSNYMVLIAVASVSIGAIAVLFVFKKKHNA